MVNSTTQASEADIRRDLSTLLDIVLGEYPSSDFRHDLAAAIAKRNGINLDAEYADKVAAPKRRGKVQPTKAVKVEPVKVHTRFDKERSLCGLHPKHGKYVIESFAGFFSADDDQQCHVCLKRVKNAGYNVEAMRAKYRKLIDVQEG